MNNTELCRRSLYDRAGVVDRIDLSDPQWSAEFEQLMRNRLLMGALRYGKLGDPDKPRYDRIKRAHELLNEYSSTGNTECLVDVANMALVEFVEGDHPKKHFEARDDKEHAV